MELINRVTVASTSVRAALDRFDHSVARAEQITSHVGAEELLGEMVEQLNNYSNMLDQISARFPDHESESANFQPFINLVNAVRAFHDALEAERGR